RNDQRTPKLKNRSFPEIICLNQLRNCSPIFLRDAAYSIAFPDDVLAEENPLAVGQRSNLLVEFVGIAFGKNQAEVETVRRRRPAEDMRIQFSKLLHRQRSFRWRAAACVDFSGSERSSIHHV